MSNSERHQENRCTRAKFKAKEGRIIRNAHHGGRLRGYHPQQFPVTPPSWWTRFVAWLRRIFKRRSGR